MRDIFPRSIAHELFAVRLVHPEHGGDEHPAQEPPHEIASTISLRRLRQGVHEDGQPETAPGQVRRLVGEASRGGGVAAQAEILLQSVRQRLQEAGHVEEASEISLRRQRGRHCAQRQIDHLMENEQTFFFSFFLFFFLLSLRILSFFLLFFLLLSLSVLEGGKKVDLS